MKSIKIFAGILRKNWGLSLINLMGLSLGISSCLFISLFVLDEWGYDRYHEKIERIFRVSTEFLSDGSVDHAAIVSSPLAGAMREGFPEVEDAVRFNNMGTEITVKVGEDAYKEGQIYKADPSVFNVFSYHLTRGDAATALLPPHHVVLTRSLGEKYFGSVDPLGKTLSIGHQDYQVTGVLEDIPENSDLRFTMLASMDSTDLTDDWFDFSYQTYVLFHKESIQSADFSSSFEKKLNAIVDENINKPLLENDHPITASLHMRPLKAVHFDPPLLYDTPKGNKNDIYIFSSVAFLILFIACLNYINFSIVQSMVRSKEVGLRKVMGAGFLNLVIRYIGESFLFTFAALMVALIITGLLLPVFNEVVARHFVVNDFFESHVIVTMISIVIIVGILAGSYPALFMAGINPVTALKNKITTPKGQAIRKASIAVQFFISIGLLICTVVIYRQMSYVKNYDLGFRKDNVVVIPLPADSTLQQRAMVLKERLLKNTNIKSVSLAGLGSLPGTEPERGSIVLKTDGKEDVRMINHNYVDEDYLPTLDIRLMDGRNFQSTSDLQNSVIVNEALVNMMGWKKPLEQQISWAGEFRNIIGVVRDFHYISLYNKVDPQVIVYHERNIRTMFVVLNGSEFAGQIHLIKEAWDQSFPYEPFSYTFLDDTVNAQYQKESHGMRVFTYFTVITVGISCLGLFGLSSLTIFQRKKEIGIRKIVGANFYSLLLLLSREYFLLVLLSLCMVSPVAWWIMRQWLETFLYHAPMQASLFVSVGVGILVASLLTILFSMARISGSKSVDLIRET